MLKLATLTSLYNHIMFDLFVLPLQLIRGQEETHMPQLAAVDAPKRCDRSRSSDRFLILISLIKGKSLSTEEYSQLASDAATTYYNSRGSITAGLRAAAEGLNTALLGMNQKATFETQPRLAVVNLAAIRGSDLYLAHAGTTHTFILTKDGVQAFSELEGGNRGLGFSRSTPIRYYQTGLQNADLVLFSHNPPPGWNKDSLADASKQTLDHLRRRLLDKAGSDIQAALIQVRQGKGDIHRLKPRTLFVASGSPLPPHLESASAETAAKSGTAAAMTQPETSDYQDNIPVYDTLPDISAEPIEEPDEAGLAAPEAVVPPPEPEMPQEELPEPETEAAQPIEPEAEAPQSFEPAADTITPARAPSRPRRPVPFAGEPVAEQEPPVAPAGDTLPQQAEEPGGDEPQASEEPVRNDSWKQSLRERWLQIRSRSARQGASGGGLLARIFAPDHKSRLSTRNMLFIAIVVPLIVVAIGATVYFRLGRAERHQAYLLQAAQQVELARNSEGPKVQRQAWNQALSLLEQAEGYGMSSQSRQLRQEIEATLDSMEGITRSLFQPILVQQTEGVNITRMVANMNDVYALDASENRVLRLELSGNTYSLDETFNCSSGAHDVRIVSDLVDIIILPVNSPFGATVLAVDKTGNLMYCIPGEPPVVTSLAPPDNNWGQPVDIDLGGTNLFILDILKDTMLSYRGTNQAFDQNPNWFFDDEKPKLSDLIAISAYGNDVYMLHADGSMSLCTYRLGRDDTTKCNDVSYFDERPGAETEPRVMGGTRFIQLISTEPPQSSLFILDADTPAIYQFSLRLTFIKQIRPLTNDDYSVPQVPATAFVVTPGRNILLAFGDVIYKGFLP